MDKKELERLREELLRQENKYKLTKEKLELILRHLDLEYTEHLKEDNPIEHINIRVKKINSIQKKLNIKGRQCTLENIDDYLSDIVGARIVCPFLSDVEKVINDLKNHPELKVLLNKDYISNPKGNGYASYHMIVLVPVVIDNKEKYVRAEIQIRTMAMDMWASLDHKICYKKGIKLSEEATQAIAKTAIDCRNLDELLNKKYLEQKSKVKEINQKENDNWLTDKEYKKLIDKHEYALNQVLGEINLLNKRFNEDEKDMVEVNPIEHIKYRIKPKKRILSKLQRQTNNLLVESIEENISDIAGIRIVCSFEQDVFRLVDIIKNNLGLEVIKEKDYVTQPKESGYAGYHLIVKVPVPQYGNNSYAKVEIQIRTIAMDMWASLEHKLCYQKQTNNETKQELLQIAYDRWIKDKQMEMVLKETRRNQNEKRLIKSKINKPS